MQVAPGTRAFVTGASRGIGRALASALAARGVTLGLAARSTDELAALAAELPGEHRVLECDVADAASTQAAIDGFASAPAAWSCSSPTPDHPLRPVPDQPLDKALQMSQVNWHGTLHTVHFGLPHLLRRGQRAHRRRLQRRRAALVPAGRGLRRDEGRPADVRRGAAPRARRHRRLVTTVYPGEIATSLHDHEKDRMPAWYRGGPQAAPAEALAEKIVAAIEGDERAVYHPPLVRALGIVHGLNPKAGDALLRRLRGDSAAPRRG